MVLSLSPTNPPTLALTSFPETAPDASDFDIILCVAAPTRPPTFAPGAVRSLLENEFSITVEVPSPSSPPTVEEADVIFPVENDFRIYEEVPCPIRPPIRPLPFTVADEELSDIFS